MYNFLTLLNEVLFCFTDLVVEQIHVIHKIHNRLSFFELMSKLMFGFISYIILDFEQL
jgi:hypothetical protein